MNPMGGAGFTTKSTDLRGVLLADLFELLVPGGSAIVRFLLEPGDQVYVCLRADVDVAGLQGTQSRRVNRAKLALFTWTLVSRHLRHVR